MIAIALVQAVLDGLGAFLGRIYDLVPNYGVAIIIFTAIVRLFLLPLGIKQVRSMHEMQSIQPQIRQVQQKYKGNRQKMNEEVMKLYQEHGVNPLASCWPLLLQLPVLFALFAVLRAPTVTEVSPGDYEIASHIPKESRLYEEVIKEQHAPFVGSNLLCNALEAGRTVPVRGPDGEQVPEGADIENERDCGSGIPARIPYYAFAALMIGTSYFQQRQMQKAAPPGAQTQQMQTLTRVMPLVFGFWGFIFPAGLVVYWTTSNFWQIGQQHFLIKARKELDAKGGPLANKKRKPRKGLMARMMEQAQAAKGQQGTQEQGDPKGEGPAPPGDGGGTTKGKPQAQGGRKPGSQRKPSSGGRGAGSRKKRRKR